MPVVLTFDFPPRHGGVQRYMERLASSLHAQRHGVCVVAPAQEETAGYDAALPYPVFRFGGASRAEQCVQASRALCRARMIVEDDFTIAASWLPAGFVAAYTPRRGRRRLTILCHGSELTRATIARRALFGPVFERAETIVAVSSFTAGLLRTAGITRAAVVSGGVDPRAYSPAPAASPTILSVGRLVPRKGFDRVLVAIQRLRLEFPDVRYEIVGDGPQRAELEALAQRLGITSCVTHAGSVDDGELARAYARAWCFAMPVRREGDDVEGFGLVYLEAAMAGLPVVAGRHSGASDAVADGTTGFLVDGQSADQIAAALARLLRDRRRAIAMGEAGRARALAQFSWDRSARRLATVMGLAAS